jgi:hypothetical protein
MFAWLAGLIYQLGHLAMAFVLAAFLALGLRAVVLLTFDRGRGALCAVMRLVAALGFLGLGLLYGLLTAHVLAWSWGSAIVALGTAALVLLTIRIPQAYVRGGRKVLPRVPGVRPFVSQVGALIVLLAIAFATLLWSGFLTLTEDRLVLLLDLTGETRPQVVGWGPPDRPYREATLTTHRVVFKTVDGAPVAEAWIYGDQVAVKGRVLRLSPLLNAAGVPNLFELQFAHNGYATSERHNEYPHLSHPLPALGPLQVHGWWRPLQTSLMKSWESGSTASTWAIRSSTLESTYFALVDAQGQPIKHVYRLVVTPGGLSSS